MRRGRPPYPDLLTPREQEVLSLIREGLTNQEIADSLGISESGARYHVSEILGKLGVTSRAEAAAWRQEQPAASRRFGFAWPAFGLKSLKLAQAAVIAVAAVAFALLALGVLLADKRPVRDCHGEVHEATSVMPIDLARARDGGVFPPSEVREATVGQPLPLNGFDASLAMLDGSSRSMRVPIASSGHCLVLMHTFFDQNSNGGFEELVLWNPDEARGVPIPGTRVSRQNAGDDRRIEGAAGEWILVRLSPFLGREEEVLLLHQETGETRSVTKPPRGSIIGRFSISRGLVVWAETSQGVSGERLQSVRAYDIANDSHVTLLEVPYEQQHFTFGAAVVGGSTVVWTDNAGGSQKLFVADVKVGSILEYPVNDGWSIGATYFLSDDGRHLLWYDRALRQMSTNLETGETVTYANANSASSGGREFAGYSNEERYDGDYARATSDGGLYNLRTQEVRPLGTRDDCLCLTLGVMGHWFVWFEGNPITPVAGINEPIPVGTFRLLELDR